MRFSVAIANLTGQEEERGKGRAYGCWRFEVGGERQGAMVNSK